MKNPTSPPLPTGRQALLKGGLGIYYERCSRREELGTQNFSLPL
jgi:hypothetical protein